MGYGLWVMGNGFRVKGLGFIDLGFIEWGLGGSGFTQVVAGDKNSWRVSFVFFDHPPLPRKQAVSDAAVERTRHIQEYLAHEKHPPPRILQ